MLWNVQLFIPVSTNTDPIICLYRKFLLLWWCKSYTKNFFSRKQNGANFPYGGGPATGKRRELIVMKKCSTAFMQCIKSVFSLSKNCGKKVGVARRSHPLLDRPCHNIFIFSFYYAGTVVSVDSWRIPVTKFSGISDYKRCFPV